MIYYWIINVSLRFSKSATELLNNPEQFEKTKPNKKEQQEWECRQIETHKDRDKYKDHKTFIMNRGQ